MNKPETAFATSFFKLMPRSIHYEKTYNPIRRSMPDYYVEAEDAVLWVEFKVIGRAWSSPQARICTRPEWVLQQRWLMRAHQHHIPAIAIVGTKVNNRWHGYMIDAPYEYVDQPLLTLSQLVDEVSCSYLMQTRAV